MTKLQQRLSELTPERRLAFARMVLDARHYLATHGQPRRKDTDRGTCPDCGGPMYRYATRCRDCEGKRRRGLC